jgi:hypothetical protein
MLDFYRVAFRKKILSAAVGEHAAEPGVMLVEERHDAPWRELSSARRRRTWFLTLSETHPPAGFATETNSVCQLESWPLHNMQSGR